MSRSENRNGTMLGRTPGAASGAVAVLIISMLCTGCHGCGGRESVRRVRLTRLVEPARVQEATTKFMESLEERFPVWQQVDRTALASSLGWGEVSRGDSSKPRIALTFDAGAGGGPTTAVLDALKAAGVHSTFFVTGQFADDFPDIVKRIAAEGHELANHSYTHPRFTTLSAQGAHSEIERTEVRLLELTGLSTRPYFRFPYGARNDALIRLVNSAGYLSVFWTVDSLDWMPQETCDSVRARVVGRAGPGAIVLMHCGSSIEAEILPAIIGDLRSAGYDLVTLTEVLM